MTVEEKRSELYKYCENQNCKACVLNVPNKWDNPLAPIFNKHCPTFALLSDDDIERVYDMLFNTKITGESIEAPKLSFSSIAIDNNPYWERISKLACKQRSKGLNEYGKGVEDDTADINTRLDRIEEELIDALMYIEHLRDGINKIKEIVE